MDRNELMILGVLGTFLLFGMLIGGWLVSSDAYEEGRYDGYHQGSEDTFTYVTVKMSDENWTVSEFDREYGIYYYIGASRFPDDPRFDGIPRMRLFGIVIWDGVYGWFP